MKPFTELTLTEQIQYERFTTASKRLLRHELLIMKNLAEAELEEKSLSYLTSLSGFNKLNIEIQGLIRFPSIYKSAKYLKIASSSLIKRKSAIDKLQEIEKALKILE